MKTGDNRAVCRFAAAGVALASAALLSACVSSPTYGTGKASDVQLLEDVTGMLSLGPNKKEQIDYKPRPELVKPASTAALPAPQDPLVTAANPAWPEAPEQRRARIRAEATLNRDEADFQPEVLDDAPRATPKSLVRRTRGDDMPLDSAAAPEGSPEAQRAEFNRRLAEGQQGSATTRKFLSEPPLDYRRPAETAAVGDIGEDEWRKQKRREQGGTKKSWDWADLWPF